ncbi:helix-turn-helix domain-containing protein [Tunturiibacter empetritectus]|uniref:DNA-binding HxlR family transcriptional regulator n=1 Tax=Tunturiibacter lichenicola TaxID=2051959 RepID=A0A852VFV1_9BACT|nr:helix-turn-helix domain-containing protein [Edaphobacter lichenicola]NYF90477.1 DNA-binding HxlR family transcriptional regulator [Edaphobacter lichenicola]
MATQAKVLASRQRRRKGNLYDANCPSRVVLDHITSRWGSLVLLTLLDGTQRFSELVRGIGGVSEKMLAQSLKALEADGLVLRTVYPTIPPKVEYSLTSLGTEVADHIKTLTNWVEDNVSEIKRHRTKHSSLLAAPISVPPSTSPMRR